MRKGLFALATIGLIIVSASAGYLAGTFRTLSPTTTTTFTPIALPSSVCATPIHHPNATGTIDVYQIALESIGVICVSYEFHGNGSYSFSPTNYGPQVGSSNSSWIACGAKNGSTVASACSGLSITPSQPSINHLTSHNITVAYTVRTETSVPGLFWFFIASCDAIPLAIGLDSTFVSPPPGFGCTAALGAPTSVTVTGTWNINATVVFGHTPVP
jgi:hypothetical protein